MISSSKLAAHCCHAAVAQLVSLALMKSRALMLIPAALLVSVPAYLNVFCFAAKSGNVGARPKSQKRCS
jgi:hypothetical protein